MIFLGVLPTVLSFMFLVGCCHAIPPAFVWGFSPDFVSTSLQECQELDLRVTSLNNDSVSFGVPPYYMMAMEVNGIPTTEYVGDDRDSLYWTVRHAAGATLMLGMVDSNRSGGGIAPNLFTVIPGQNSSCLPAPPAANFTVTANVTTTLTTCQPWGMAISGGVKPYTVTLAALNSPIITNVTLGPADDFFTFIDRADPNTQLVAVISDANGTFAAGTPLVQTKGSTNVSCPGLVSSSGDAAKIQAAQQAAERALEQQQTHQRVIKAIAIVVTLMVVLALAGAVAYLRIRQPKWVGVRLGDPELKPRQYEQYSPTSIISGPLALSVSASFRAAGAPASSEPSPTSPADSSGIRHDAFCLPDCECRRRTGLLQHYPSGFPTKRPPPPPLQQRTVVNNNSNNNNAMPSPVLRRKAQEVQMRAVPSVGEVQLQRVGTATAGASAGAGAGERRRRPLPLPLRTRTLPPIPIPANGEGDRAMIVIQHRDGGRAVEEIPPPYRSRSSRAS